VTDRATDSPASRAGEPEACPSWLVGLCGVAAAGSLLFTLLLFLNR
jgi:hypothetical protein